MDPAQLHRAVEAGRLVATGLGLRVDDTLVVNNSDRIAVRLLPCDVLARVGPAAHEAGFDFEVQVARCLADNESPIAVLEPHIEPRTHIHDGFVVSFWTYYSHRPSSHMTPPEYAEALTRLHVGFRQADLQAPHFTDRVADAERLADDPDQTPELRPQDRAFVGAALDRLSRAVRTSGSAEQLLHGEPHPGNLLLTAKGPLFIDLGTCCRGPVEFDIAHGLLPSDGHVMPLAAVVDHYPSANQALIDQCHALIWAMITMWRWRRDDQLPNGRYWRTEGLNRLRAALGESAS